MPLKLDAEIAAAYAAASGESGLASTAPRGDVLTLRKLTETTLAALDSYEQDSPDVSSTDHLVEVEDGSSIPVRWYTKIGCNVTAAVIYLHGGGMVSGSVDLYDRLVARYVQDTGVPFLSVDYRLAPEFPGDTPVRDSHAALSWLVASADDLGIDRTRIAVMGDSGGGGIAAGVAILARNGQMPLAKQILIYPMLDDRTQNPDHEIASLASWTYDDNYTAWHGVLGEKLGTEFVSPLAAPARLRDFRALPPAFIDVGELDIFRDENVAYAQKLTKAGVSCELHVRPGSFHGFDRLAPESQVASASWADRCRALKSI